MSNWPRHAHEVVKGTIRDYNAIAMAALLDDVLRYCFSCFKICTRRDNLIVPRAELRDFEHRFGCFQICHIDRVSQGSSICEQPGFAESTEFTHEEVVGRFRSAEKLRAHAQKPTCALNDLTRNQKTPWQPTEGRKPTS